MFFVCCFFLWYKFSCWRELIIDASSHFEYLYTWFFMYNVWMCTTEELKHGESAKQKCSVPAFWKYGSLSARATTRLLREKKKKRHSR